MKCLLLKNQADIILLFNAISRYLDDLPNIDNGHFDLMVDHAELHLDKASSSYTEVPFLD